MGDRLRFVDSVAASPTVRLDVNDETIWTAQAFDPGFPETRLNVSNNAMTDGISVASSARGPRTLTLRLMLRRDTQDLFATALQTLMRELDRDTNWVEYRPTGSTKSVFFKTYRGAPANVTEILTATANRVYEVALLADPYGIGVAETGSGTVAFDPNNATPTGFESVLPTILGDVEVPLNIDLTSLPGLAALDDKTSILVGTGFISGRVFTQEQSSALTLGTNTTLTTAAGTGYWRGDYHTTTFATLNNIDEPRIDDIRAPTDYAGRYRVMVRVDATSAAASTFSMRLAQHRDTAPAPMNYTATVSATLGTTVSYARGLVDLGIIRIPYGSDYLPVSDGITIGTQRLSFRAMRTSGTGNLIVDGFLIIPVALDEPGSRDTALIIEAGLTAAGLAVRIDSQRERVVQFNPASANNFSLAIAPSQLFGYGAQRLSGSFPKVRPGGENRLRIIPFGGGGSVPTTESVAYAFTYNPAYLHVRPSGT